jgi:hypothetical protein
MRSTNLLQMLEIAAPDPQSYQLADLDLVKDGLKLALEFHI